MTKPMEPVKFRIWWSPFGGPDGHDVIEALDKKDATARALEKMREHSNIGAYGADKIQPV